MKKLIQSSWRLPLVASPAVVILCVGLLTSAKAPGHYVAHEWGTFTSVQGGDGVLLEWNPLESSALPHFVYDWKNPGLNRRSSAAFVVGKTAMWALQRMETPVIYFYADQKQTVDASVSFPQGAITEWYPQACQVGPSTVPVPPAIAKLDEYAHKAGAGPGFTFASLLGHRDIKDSRIKWGEVELLPPSKNGSLTHLLATDQSGSHYFAARDTDSDYVKMYSLSATNPAPEFEKFLFYRGVGNFKTPLRVTVDSADSVTVANTGTEPLTHLFLLGQKDGSGQFMELDRLEPGAERNVPLQSLSTAPAQKIADQLCQQMALALEHEGLYTREAKAMVKTWRDSWFEEDGLRVLYLLPRSWTDQILPLSLEPAPRELVRVMVGRAEALSPKLEDSLASDLLKAKDGDSQARERAMAQLRRLGRFARPAMNLAIKDFDKEASDSAWELFRIATESSKPTTLAAANDALRAK
jgi:hypothetical protein